MIDINVETILALTEAAKRLPKRRRGKRPHVAIYGTDYPTPDGTGVRDYIHVSDLASAHIE